MFDANTFFHGANQSIFRVSQSQTNFYKDNILMQAERIIQSVFIHNALVVVDWEDGQQQKLEPILLKHSPGFPGAARPAGPEGRFPSTSSHLSIASAELTSDGDICLKWQPGDVVSVHYAKWIQECRPVDHDPSQIWPEGLALWDAAIARNLSNYNFSTLNESELARVELFDQILDRGVGLICGVPDSSSAVQNIASWFGQIPPNPYADDQSNPALSSIRVDPDQPVATHMCHFLGPHTDTCWRQTLIGLLLMHCLKAHPSGGRSLLVDGFMVADRLRDTDTEAFELLSTIPINFGARVGDKDDWRVWGRIISVTADGVIQGIRYNGNSIGDLDLPSFLIAPMYRALEKFESILYDRDLWWQPMLQPGEAIVIDNHRILHGREAFNPESGERHLLTCSVDRDDFHNNYRRIARRMKSTRSNNRFSAGVL